MNFPRAAIRLATGAFAALLLAAYGAVAEAGPALLEVKLRGKAYQGKLVARDNQVCWLMARDGRLFNFQIDKIEAISEAAPQFRRYSKAEIRDILRREYGQEFEVVGSEHYLVCGLPGSSSRYALLFEEIYRSVYHYFSRRGFRVEEPEFPLLAVVLPDQAEFMNQCRRDGVRGGPGLLGYYHPDSNRVALFDNDAPSTAAAHDARIAVPAISAAFTAGQSDGVLTLGNGWPSSRLIAAQRHVGEISGDLKDTIVHEATHQVAFNIGLHSRIGENPKWVVEGLATAFEVLAMHDPSSRDSARERINTGRFIWFTNFAATRRKPKSLGDFVASDRMFVTSGQDAYAQSWALTFFLLETRPDKFARYLRAIQSRNVLLPYPAEERAADFCAAFGRDLEMLDAEFLRFLERLK